MRYIADLFHRCCMESVFWTYFYACCIFPFVQSRTMSGCTFASAASVEGFFIRSFCTTWLAIFCKFVCLVALELAPKFSNEVNAVMALRVIAIVLFMWRHPSLWHAYACHNSKMVIFGCCTRVGVSFLLLQLKDIECNALEKKWIHQVLNCLL